MAALTPAQRRWRNRVEAAIRLAEPGLNLVLAAGERLSRVVGGDGDDYYPPQRGNLPPAPPPRVGGGGGPAQRGAS